MVYNLPRMTYFKSIFEIFRARQAPAAAPYPVMAEGCVYYIIGDIHGRIDLLKKIHGLIKNDIADHDSSLKKNIVYLGDYIDRGDHSREVIDYLLNSPLKEAHSIYLKGNHEDTLLQFYDSPDIGAHWFKFGGMATLLSYNLKITSNMPSSEQIKMLWEHFKEQLPPDHLAFYQDLQLMHEAGDYLFVHAGIMPGRKLIQQSPRDMMWIRDEFLEFERSHEKFIVHGHSISSEPEIKPNRIGIDTGAYYSNRLTCLVLHDSSRRFLST